MKNEANWSCMNANGKGTSIFISFGGYEKIFQCDLVETICYTHIIIVRRFVVVQGESIT